jgi:sulfite reductase (NADPH) hemoprotein beta-component
VTHQQNLVLADVKQSELRSLWRELISLGLATPNIGTLNDMICCPGLEFCSLANAGSIDVAEQINQRFPDLEELYEIGQLRINMSGCMNACGHHHVGNIGILGVDKNGEEWYQFTLGGRSGREAKLGLRLGPAIAKAQVAETIARIVNVYKTYRQDDELFVDTVDRIGIEPFKEPVYAAYH